MKTQYSELTLTAKNFDSWKNFGIWHRHQTRKFVKFELSMSAGTVRADGNLKSAEWRITKGWRSDTSFKLASVFTVRLHIMQRTVLLSQFCLSVCLSVRCVYCDKTKWCAADIFIPHETAITSVFWHQQRLVDDGPFPLKSALKVARDSRTVSLR